VSAPTLWCVRLRLLFPFFKNQLYGLAITELTSLLSRRSVYCSKTANGRYSVCEAFDNPEGNIRFGRVDHSWKNGRCVYCKFVQQAKKLNPRFLTMIIPSRWFSGGKGLDEFRESLLTDNRLRSIDNYLCACGEDGDE
jgi:hypothetical protein